MSQPKSNRLANALLSLALLTIVGCSSVEKPESPEVVRENLSYGNVVLVHTGSEIEQPTLHVTVTAAFVNHINLSERKASRILRLPATDWQRGLPLGSCQTSRQDLREIARLDPNEVQLWLLDVGRLSVSLNSQRIVLDYENFPDIWPHIAGVTYRTRKQDQLPYQAGKWYTVKLEGNDSGDATVHVLAPPALRLLGVGTLDEKPQDGERSVDFGRDLPVFWSAATTDAHGLRIIIERTQAQLVHRVVCHVADDGHFVIPATALSQLPFDGDGETRLVLQRLNSETLKQGSTIPTRVHFLVEASAMLQSL